MSHICYLLKVGRTYYLFVARLFTDCFTAVCENLGNTQIFCERVVSCAQKGNQAATPLVQATVRCRSTLTIHIIPYHHISHDLKECTLRLLDSGWELEDHFCVARGVSSRSCYR